LPSVCIAREKLEATNNFNFYLTIANRRWEARMEANRRGLRYAGIA
jgi:hypothetical protein